MENIYKAIGLFIFYKAETNLYCGELGLPAEL